MTLPPDEASVEKATEILLNIGRYDPITRDAIAQALSVQAREIDQLKAFISKYGGDLLKTRDATISALQQQVEELKEYVTHDKDCPLDRWQQGRPTADGHYETMYDGKWYRDDDKPECTCGLDAALSTPAPEAKKPSHDDKSCGGPGVPPFNGRNQDRCGYCGGVLPAAEKEKPAGDGMTTKEGGT